MDLNRRDNETEFEYKVRICLAKLNKEVDLDWYEIVELLGLECSSDHLRKLAYGYKEYHDYIADNPGVTSEDEKMLEIREKINELQITKIQVQDEKRMLRNIQREEARRRTLRDTILNRIDRLNNEKHLINEEVKIVETKKIGCVLLSDLHYGAKVESYLNCYNADIACERMTKYKDKIVEIADKENLEKINVELLGDLIENFLHITGKIDSDRDTAEQVVECAELISEFIYNIAKETGLPIEVYNVEGNHDRCTQKKEDSLTGESFSYIMEAMIKRRLHEVKNVKFNENTYRKDIAVMYIYDKTVALVHGHRDRKSGVKQNLNDFLRGMEYFDKVHMGHWHEFEALRGDIIINGSVKGSDNYSQNLRYSTPPQQVVVVYEEDGTESIIKVTL